MTFILGSGSVYNTSDQFQDRTRLTGTPLGVGLAIELFIHEIAFVSIWPNQQASEYFESTRKTVRT